MILRKLLVCFFIFFVANTYAQNKLDSAKKSIKTSKTKTRGSNVPIHTSHENAFSSMFAEALAHVFLYTTYGVLVDFGELESERHHNALLTKYPYFENSKGDFNFTANKNQKTSRFVFANKFLKLSQRIKGNYLNGKLQFSKKFSVTGDFLYLNENNFRGLESAYSHLSFLVNYHRVRTEKLNLWYGIGYRYVGSGVNKSGFSYQIGSQYFFAKPLSVDVTYLGAIVNESSIGHFQTNLNYHIKNKFVSVGLTNFKLGSEKFNGIAIGLGIYF
ncbi:hypothetical protein ACFLSU_04570 [Bacteroidota bacterium]